MSNFKDNGIRGILIHQLDLTAHDELTAVNERDLAEKITESCGIDQSIWKIDKFRITGNAWTVNGKFGSGNDTRWEEAVNGQVKCVIDYIRIAPDNKNEFKEDLLATLKNNSPIKRAKKNYVKDGALLLNDIPDHHLGRLSYGKETGDNYDIKIASERFNTANAYFLSEAEYMHKRNPIEKMLFVIGNDYFNYDYAKPFPQTSNGTAQESDVRFQKMFNIGSHMVIKQIEHASEIAEVDIIIIPGNHDEQMSFYLGEVLNAYFYNNKRVNVNVSPKLRKYYKHGKNMLGFSHGQYEKFERLFANMAFEEMEMWANTIYKYFYLGHTHHKDTRIKVSTSQIQKDINNTVPHIVTEDLNGVLFDRLASLTSNDYYESSRGFIHIKMAESFLFSKEYGKIHTFTHQLPISIHSKNNNQ